MPYGQINGKTSLTNGLQDVETTAFAADIQGVLDGVSNAADMPTARVSPLSLKLFGPAVPRLFNTLCTGVAPTLLSQMGGA